ncbi:MAG TPA: Mini-ribonuclease 3 [Atopostipes sp.]|nr:Mini-ribonuclease 3 [Atopostipes sp.]
MNEAKLLNGLALAYMGDAVFEVAIRDYLLGTGKTKPNQLHQTATRYVSAKAQARMIAEMLESELLTEEEISYYKRGRNSKINTKAKNTDIQTYLHSTGFEALMGFLYLTKQQERLDTLIEWCIEFVGRKSGNE